MYRQQVLKPEQIIVAKRRFARFVIGCVVAIVVLTFFFYEQIYFPPCDFKTPKGNIISFRFHNGADCVKGQKFTFNYEITGAKDTVYVLQSPQDRKKYDGHVVLIFEEKKY